MVTEGISIRYTKEMIGIARSCWPNQATLFNVIKSVIETTVSKMIDKYDCYSLFIEYKVYLQKLYKFF